MARQSKPWFRNSKNTWYCTLEGRKVSLGVQGVGNEKEAISAWHRLMGGMPLEAPPTPRKPTVEPQAEVKAVSVESVITAFLADAKSRVIGETQRVWAQHLLPFAECYGKRGAESLTVTQAESFIRKP